MTRIAWRRRRGRVGYPLTQIIKNVIEAIGRVCVCLELKGEMR